MIYTCEHNNFVVVYEDKKCSVCELESTLTERITELETHIMDNKNTIKDLKDIINKYCPEGLY